MYANDCKSERPIQMKVTKKC